MDGPDHDVRITRPRPHTCPRPRNTAGERTGGYSDGGVPRKQTKGQGDGLGRRSDGDNTRKGDATGNPLAKAGGAASFAGLTAVLPW